jgi:hypothetical protein
LSYQMKFFWIRKITCHELYQFLALNIVLKNSFLFILFIFNPLGNFVLIEKFFR